MHVHHIIEDRSHRVAAQFLSHLAETVRAFAQGNDTFVSLPTGYRKSAVYVVLAYVFDRLKG